jgi:hypothetical protein
MRVRDVSWQFALEIGPAKAGFNAVVMGRAEPVRAIQGACHKGDFGAAVVIEEQRRSAGAAKASRGDL